MRERVPASETTTKRIEALVSGRTGSVERSKLVKVTARLIVEELLEGEVEEQSD